MRRGVCLTITLTLLWWCVREGRGNSSWSSSKFQSLRSDPDGGVAAVRNSSESEVCTNLDIRNSVKQFKKLENCAVVEGFVQILLIDNAVSKDFENISFPKLQEITGYLLLYRVQGLPSLSKIFPNLVVIRGDVLFHNYALVIYELRSMLEVGLSNLTTILRGSVRIEKNSHLCYVNTIDWDRIAKAGRGGHLVKRNKPLSECPDTCPSDADCPINILPNGRQQRLCWNPHTCQKVCSLDCEHQNVTCSTKHKCCHKECLGGCNGSLANQCVACRHVVYQGRCMQYCPSGTYKYLDRRCLEEEKCKRIKNRLSILPVTQEVHWKPFKGECLPQCPSGYAVNNSNKHQCSECEGQCPKICDGAVIDSVSSAQKLKGCTYINGSLDIHIQGGDNIIKELESSLSSIYEIWGYLKIARSFPLISLNFLRDLTYIRGQQLEKKIYALLVLDNQNLQELWNWESRTTKLKIEGGKVFFHFNSKLCLNKINDLRKYADVQPWGDTDVSPSSNGDRVACNVVNMEIQTWLIGAEVAGLKWKNFRKSHSDVDFRSLLGYVVYHREAPEENVSIFDGRDACGADVWKVHDVEADEDSDYIITILTHLKPFTTYAAYMRTYTIASASLGAQSPIIYFTTKPHTPSPPVNVQAISNNNGEIFVSWASPKRPNGNVTHYIINGIREKDSSEFISQRNYCIEPLVIPQRNSKPRETKDKDEIDNDGALISTEKSKSKNGKTEECCSCSKTKPQPDKKDDDAESQILFEDYLHNSVYIKNPDADKATKNQFHIALPKALTTPASILEFTTKSQNETLTQAIRNSSSTETIDESSTEISTRPTPDDEDGKFHYKIYNETYIVIKKLHHFTEYTIEVRACQDAPPDDHKMDECSSQAITTVRTLPLGGADDIELSSILIHKENLTSGILYANWDEPKDFNGLIVSYHIEIKPADANEYKPIPVCITQLEYQKKMGYILYDLMPGNYSLRLRATSLAGNGNWTNSLYFLIPEARGGLRSEFIALLVIALIVTACSVVGIPLYLYYRKKYGNDIPGMLYASVNPEYMSAVYEPDEWEVPREKITLRQELGQGSFGMVYKGEFKTEDGTLLKCAVKTVNESASLRERIEFLQEASVMKAFNCHHVVKLLGVVSKGHPTLVIMELMGKGDLKAYLRSRRPDYEENIDYPNAQPPTLKEILQMAVEIADGMAYLAAKKFVHRDLAARNCMVSDDLTVKIGDFGMTRDIYETDYYRKGGKGLLPVRWMAPECLKDGLFSSQSDIWSYGVVLWEMATLASQPYQGLANEQVLQFVISGGRMTKPENCPEKLYAIMDLCWDKNPKARPTFIELIDMLLPDVEKSKFREVSFYFTQRLETSAKESELNDTATASTPMRTQWMDSTVLREDSDTESEVIYFPQTRNTSHRNYKRNSSDQSANYHESAAQGDSRAYSVHSNEGSKGMSLTSSDDSKGSKVSNTSNGSIVNGHVTFAPGRTTMC